MSLDGARLALIILVVLTLIIGALVLRREAARRKRKGARRYPLYVEGLHLLLDGKPNEAIQAFRTAAEDGPYVVEARLRLGDILRQRGAWEQALRVHNSLRVIPSLADDLAKSVALALANDYRRGGQPERAVHPLEEALAALGPDPEVLELLLITLEEAGKWEEAIDVARKLEKAGGDALKGRIAGYHVARAHESLEEGSERKAKSELKKALTEDSTCAAAHLMLGDLTLEGGDVDRAVDEWVRMAEVSPALSRVAFLRIERALYDAGKYGRIPEVYARILEKRPDDIVSLLRLANYAERKGALEEAVEQSEQAVEASPEAITPRASLAAYLSDLERSTDASRECREVVRICEDRWARFECEYCGHAEGEFSWRCPACKRVGAFRSGNDCEG